MRRSRTAREVLVRISRCGVCHSDIHLQDGYFRLGGDKKLDVTARPLAALHARARDRGRDRERRSGRATRRPDSGGRGLSLDRLRRMRGLPRGEENLCAAPRHLGIQVDGGFATHVLVPHPRYLIDYAPLPAALAGAYMCSGLTAYSALKRLAAHAKRGPVLLVGLGGVGMMGLAFARAMFAHAPIVADIDRGQARGRAQGGRRGRLRSGRSGRPQGAGQGHRRRLRRGRFRRLGRLAAFAAGASPRAARSSSLA